MNNSEAEMLAVLICQTWRNTAPTDIWVDEMRDMHYARANAAYRTLRRESTHTPSIAQFIAAYNASAVSEAAVSGCERCNHSGWTSTSFVQRGHVYDGVRPCSCLLGREREAVHAKVLAASDALRRELSHE